MQLAEWGKYIPVHECLAACYCCCSLSSWADEPLPDTVNDVTDGSVQVVSYCGLSNTVQLVQRRANVIVRSGVTAVTTAQHLSRQPQVNGCRETTILSVGMNCQNTAARCDVSCDVTATPSSGQACDVGHCPLNINLHNELIYNELTAVQTRTERVSNILQAQRLLTLCAWSTAVPYDMILVSSL